MKLRFFLGLLALALITVVSLQSFTPAEDDLVRSYSGLYAEVDKNLTVSNNDVLWEGRFEKAVDIWFTVSIDSASSVLVQSSNIPGGGWITKDTMSPTASTPDDYLFTDAGGYVRLIASITGTTKDIDFGIKVTDAQ